MLIEKKKKLQVSHKVHALKVTLMIMNEVKYFCLYNVLLYYNSYRNKKNKVKKVSINEADSNTDIET